MSKPREIELKFDLDPSETGKLKTRLRRLGCAEQGTKRLASVYFDTTGRHLQSDGLTLRIRAVGARRIQTVKSSAGAGVGLFDRGEWESDVEGDEPDLKAAADTPLAELLAKVSKPLTPVFQSIVDRHIWTSTTERAEIELALDEGQIVAGSVSQPFAELELELKRGRPGDLFDLVKQLGDLSSLRLGVLTKSERGYRLLGGKASTCRKAEPVALARGVPTAAAFQTIVRSCLRQVRLNEPLVVGGREAEALHQMRVGMRRLRSALALFKTVVADEAFEGLASRLQTASRAFGTARNLDVYLSAIAQPEAETNPDEPGIAAYLDAIEARRAAAYDDTVRTLRSRAFRGLMVDLLAWIETGPWLTSDDPMRKALRERPIEMFAAERLDAFRRKIRKGGRHLERLDPHLRHRLRIKAKKLRYATDFFSGLVGRKRRGRHDSFLEALADLQQHLGDLNDIATAQLIATDLAVRAKRASTRDPALALLAAGHAAGLQEARTDDLLGKAHAAHRAFAEAKPFWSSWAGK